MKKKAIDYEIGSSNVFKDLGFPDADDLLARSQMIMAINDIAKERGLTQAEFAKITELGQPDVSRLLRGDLNRFSTDRVMQVLNRLGRDIEGIARRSHA